MRNLNFNFNRALIKNYNLFSTKTLRTQPKFRIRKAKPTDSSKVLKLFQNSFGECEPLVKGLQMSDRSYSPALTEFWRNNVDQGMTFIALPYNNSNNSNEPFAAIVNTKLTPWDSDQWWKFSSCIKCKKTKDLICLYSFIVQDSEMHSKYKTGKIFNIQHVLVDNKECQQYNSDLNFTNVATNLIEKSFKMAPLGGFKIASFICTGKKMSSIAENLNMDLIYEYPYVKLVNKELKPIVKAVDENSFVKIYTKELTKHDYLKIY